MAFWMVQGNAGEMSDPVTESVSYPSLQAAMDARNKMFSLVFELEDGLTPQYGMQITFAKMWYHTPACGWYQWDTDYLPTTINQWDCTNPQASFYLKEHKPDGN